MEQIIWQGELDDIYHCQVTRIDEYRGVLTMKRGEQVVLSREIPLAYGAQFGPDIDDVAVWQDICADKADELAAQEQPNA